MDRDLDTFICEEVGVAYRKDRADEDSPLTVSERARLEVIEGSSAPCAPEGEGHPMQRQESYPTELSRDAAMEIVRRVFERQGGKVATAGETATAKFGSTIFYRLFGAFTPDELVPLTAHAAMQEGNRPGGGRELVLTVDLTSREGPALIELASHRTKVGKRMDEMFTQISTALSVGDAS